MNSGQPAKNDKLPKTLVDRPDRVPTGHHQWLVATKQGQWPHAKAGEVWGWPTSHSLPSEAKTNKFLVHNQAQNRQVKRSWGEARDRHLRELRTNTNMDDHRVFRRWRSSLEDGQKWGVYSCPSLTELKSHKNDGSKCQSLETTHFWQGRRLRQAYKIARYVPAGGGKMQRTCTVPNITYDHAKKAVTKHNMQQF